ncbi:TonB-dependent receptor [Maricurvus nonylphenolicus]|uniref:TonB-dependent receptor n=1 Tax=Maricurvus nonylphenolicus TaxID=1008307 RepID=UPI0036F2CD23
MSVKSRRNLLALGVFAALVPTEYLLANTIEEIVVTAQMREQTLQEVPMSVSAFTGEALKDANLNNFKDLFSITPGVSGQTEDSFFDAVSVRGISNNGFGSGSDPAIGVFLDGVSQSRTGATPTMFDMARVEVVKGPQGTLFGRNTASGAISMVSQKPGNEFGGEVSVGFGELGRKEASVSVDLPITDDLAMRLSGIHEEEDGHVKNLAGGRDLGQSEVDAVRLVTVYDGWEDASLTVLIQHEERQSDGTIYRALDTQGDFDEVFNDQRGNDESEITDVIATLDIDLDGMKLTSISGYKTHDYSYTEDFDGTAANIDTFKRDQEGDYFSQEFRLASTGDGPFHWVTGVSYYQEDIDATFSDNSNEDYLCDGIFVDEGVIAPADSIRTCSDLADLGGPIAALPSSGYASTAEAMDDLFGTDNIGTTDPFSYTSTNTLFERSVTEGKFSGWGVYGNLSWELSEATELSLGVRYTEDKKEYSVNAAVPDSWIAGWNNVEIFTDGEIKDTNTWENLSGRIALSHQLTEQWNIYGSVATGYKSGGFDYLRVDITGAAVDGVVDAANGVPARFDEESVLAYEIGAKGVLLDDTMNVNISLFSYTYEDLQQAFFDGSGGATITDNLGESEGQGLEVDLRWLIGDSLDLYVGMAYLDTEFSGAPNDLCDSCDGNEMPFSPEFSGVTMLTYTIDTGLGKLALTGEYTYTASQYSEVSNDKQVQIDSFEVVNLRAALSSEDDTWRLTAYIDNVFEEEYYNWGYSEDTYNLPATQTDPSRPRTVGARVDYRF